MPRCRWTPCARSKGWPACATWRSSAAACTSRWTMSMPPARACASGWRRGASRCGNWRRFSLRWRTSSWPCSRPRKGRPHELPPDARHLHQGTPSHHARCAQPGPGPGPARADAAAVRFRAQPGCRPYTDHVLRPGPDAGEPRACAPVRGIEILRDPRDGGRLRHHRAQHRPQPDPDGRGNSARLFAATRRRPRRPGADSARRQRFQHRVDCAGLCGIAGAQLFVGPAHGGVEPARGRAPGAAGGCAPSRLVQQLAGIQKLRGAGPDRRHPADHRGAIDLADHRARVGNGDHGTDSLHAAASGGDGAGQDVRLFRGGPGGRWDRRAGGGIRLRGAVPRQPAAARGVPVRIPVRRLVLGNPRLGGGPDAGGGLPTGNSDFVPAGVSALRVRLLDRNHALGDPGDYPHRSGALHGHHLEGYFLERRGAERLVGRVGIPDALRDRRIPAGHAQAQPEAGVNAMWERIFTILRKEFIQALREPRMRVLLFVPPMVQLIVFGFAVNLDVDHARIAWMDMDRTPESRSLRDRFTGSGRFDIVSAPASEEDVQRTLDRGEAQAVVRILPGFARDTARGRATEVQILIDGTNSNTASLVASYAGEIVAEYSVDLMDRQQRVKVLARSPGSPASVATPRVTARSRVWFNPDLYSRNYFVPGVIANIIMMVTLMLTAMSIVREKEIGTMEQLMVTPVRPIELMLGKTLPFALVGLLDVVLITVAALLVFHIPLHGSFLLLLFCTVLFLMTSLVVLFFCSWSEGVAVRGGLRGGGSSPPHLCGGGGGGGGGEENPARPERSH